MDISSIEITNVESEKIEISVEVKTKKSSDVKTGKLVITKVTKLIVHQSNNVY